MKTKTMLLASAAGVALMPNAQAADLPVKAAAIAPAASWAGWYIGGHVGAAYQQGTSTSADNAQGVYGSVTTNATSFIGGGQIGYNWQNGNFVGGIEVDGSALGAGGKAQVYGFYDSPNVSNKISWLSTVRGRTGLAVGNTMVYATAGLAIGGVKNSFVTPGDSCSSSDSFCESKTRVGFAVGGGVEYMMNRNWTLRLEGLFVDLGRSTAPEVEDSGKRTKFSNQAIIGRVGMNYKF